MRFAVYFTPPADSRLGLLGAGWLGRTSGPAMETQAKSPSRIRVEGLDKSAFERLTASPRRYGFHATLKPPFALAEGRTLEQLVASVDSFAALRRPFRVPDVAPRPLGSFIGLQPQGHHQGLSDLAAECVRAFDPFRKPPGQDELERRRKADLSPNQEKLLLSWGYPYVMEEFRFHMTLSEKLSPEEMAILLPAAERHFADGLMAGLLVDSISLFVEDSPGADFHNIRTFPFQGL